MWCVVVPAYPIGPSTSVCGSCGTRDAGHNVDCAGGAGAGSAGARGVRVVD
jgi:hypothetical protein